MFPLRALCGLTLLGSLLVAWICGGPDSSIAPTSIPITLTAASPNPRAPATAVESEGIPTKDTGASEKPKEFKPKTNAEWRKILTPLQYNVTRKKGTERAFSGKYWNTKTPGIYECVCCGQPLFKSETKFKSGTGWPSFYLPIKGTVRTAPDNSMFARRTEVLCRRCNAHLGHVFSDGPRPTGLRFCMNSAALKLAPAQGADKAPPKPPSTR